MTEQSDQDLIDKAIGGDGAAFARLVERHYASIYRIAFKCCGNQSDAEDIAQNVCVRLGQSIESFSGQSAFSSWLYRVTLNAARDFQRAGQRQMRKMTELAFVAEAVYAPDPVMDLTGIQVWEMVLQLPDKQREAVILIYSEELSHRQAAEIMACSESTVSWHIHEAKKRLKKSLTGECDG